MKQSIFVFIGLCFSVFGFGQAQKCGADWLTARNADRSEEQAAQRVAAKAIIDSAYGTFLAETATQERQVLTIPVVVHVLYKGSLENISDAQIFSQIDILNADFRRQNSDRTATPAEFLSVSADMEIEFCLAKRDPQGNATAGITRSSTPFDNIGTLVAPGGRPRIFYSTLGGADAWDSKKYLNIWVAKIGNGLLGMASFPGTAVAEEDGIVIDPRYFGDVGWAALSVPQHLGRTCTHEVGHYLDVQHIWGPMEDSCDDDDGVTDTPTQRGPYLNCPVHPQLSCGNRAMFMNFMDYTDDACQNLFTQGQKARAWATLLTVRSTLVGNSGLCTVKDDEPIRLGGGLHLYPNPATSRMYVEEESTGLALLSKVDLYALDARFLGERVLVDGFLDVSQLEKGIYFIRTQTEDTVLYARFVKR